MWEHAAFDAGGARYQLKDAWINCIFGFFAIIFHGPSSKIYIVVGISYLILLLFNRLTNWVVSTAENSRNGIEELWTPTAMLFLTAHQGIIFIFQFLMFFIMSIEPELIASKPFNLAKFPSNISILVIVTTFGFALIFSIRHFRLLIENDHIEMFDSKMNLYGGIQRYFEKLGLAILALLIFGHSQGLIEMKDILLNAFFLVSLLFLFLGLPRVYFGFRLAFIGLHTSPYRGDLKSCLKEAEITLRDRHKHTGPTELPMGCERCNNAMVIHVEDPDLAYYTICSICGAEDAYYWCEESGMGGQFIENIAEHPASFKCLGCHQIHELPADFYDHPVSMTLWEGK